MSVSWTIDQQKVIDTHNRNLLVSAAAGSGKTAVLVERIIQMITGPDHPLDVDQLLVVTFTNAAAAEMRERVGAAIEERLNANPEDRHLQRQNTLVHQAQITTIDSFCLYVIRNYFSVLDIDPSFRIGDEGELTLLAAEVMEQMIEEHYEAGNRDFQDFVETYSRGKADHGIEDYIYQVHRYARSNPWPELWIAQCRLELELKDSGDLNQTEWLQYLMEDVRWQAGELLEQIRQAMDICREEDGPAAYLAALLDDEGKLLRVQEAGDYEMLEKALSATANLTRLGAVRGKQVAVEKKEAAAAIRDRMKQILGKLRKLYCLGDMGQVRQAMEGSGPSVLTLLSLAEEYYHRFQAGKMEKNLVDFSDLEHFALKILLREEDGEMVPTEAARQLSTQFEEILIDEYQDSNLVQETLLNSISRERQGKPNVFMVGDVKQSIYRFRLARPELFMDKYHTYTKTDSSYQKIELHQNFRSRASVLTSVNQVFHKIMSKALGGIEYTDENALHPGVEFAPVSAGENWEDSKEEGNVTAEAGTPTELLLCDTKEALENLDDDKAEYTSREVEARMIAGRIRQLTDEKTGLLVLDKKDKKYRRARYSDMVILLRSVSGWAETFTNVLMNAGIPAFAESRTGYFNTVEVETVLSLLSVIDNPMQDIPMAAVLRSPIGGLTDEELAELMAAYKQVTDKGEDRGIYGAVEYVVHNGPRKEDRGIYDWERLLEEGEDQEEEEENVGIADTQISLIFGEDGDVQWEDNAAMMKREEPIISLSLCRKLELFCGLLDELEKKAAYLSIHQLLYEIYRITGYYDYASAMSGGQVRKANLDMLVEKAAAYETTSYRGVFHFIRYIENLKKYDTDFGEASTVGEQDDTVRIMSIHKSKGLEFPIVFLAGMSKKFNKQDLYGKLIIDPVMGVGADYLNLKLRVKTPTLKKHVLRRRSELESLGEELRVLYVAMTRAKEKLIMTGTVSGLNGRWEKWTGSTVYNGKLPFTMLSSADSYLDWILMSLPARSGTEEDYECFGNIRCRQIPLAALVGEETAVQVNRMFWKEELLNLDMERVFSEEYRSQLEESLSYVYPHEGDTRLHTKISVSELKRMGQQIDEEETEFLPTIPRFLEGEGLEEIMGQAGVGGAYRGTVYHRILESVPIGEIRGQKQIVECVEDLVTKKKLTADESQMVDVGIIETFLESAIGRRMGNARLNGTLKREQQFVMGIPAREMPGFEESDELVVIQGIIDACFEENGSLVLVDYKSDRLGKDGEQVLRERYQSQLDYYQRALEQITGQPVKEKIIYSLALGREIPVS